MSRALTDFGYCTYLSDLAVDEAFQRRGIGRELIRRTHDAAGRHTTLVLFGDAPGRELLPTCRAEPARVVLGSAGRVVRGPRGG